MHVYAVDLGTTNLKVVLYDERLHSLALAREPMTYRRQGAVVEFDPTAVFETVIDMIGRCATLAAGRTHEDVRVVLTGQAESLVLVDAVGIPVAPGISWMDERSVDEAAEIGALFGSTPAFAVTGEPQPVPTWPATKLRWLAKHEPEVLGAARWVLMLKDYIVMRLTGRPVGEETIRGFTYLYDVPNRRYWPEMVDFCGIQPRMLPELVPAGEDLGPILPDIADRLPPAPSYTVNSGALDHFCAMVGTGSYRPGSISASAGTVLSLSMLTTSWQFDPNMAVSFHPGLRPGETVLFSCADSGGVCLDWFHRNVAPEMDYDQLETELVRRDHVDTPIFLPYLTGVNPPDFNSKAQGGFLGLHLRHDRVDMAYAVMEGVAHLLRRNLDHFAHHGQAVDTIVSAGGGTASAFWNQLKADACDLELRVPDEPEAACRGAAVLALVAAGVIDTIDTVGELDTASTVSDLHQPTERTYRPRHPARSEARYQQFGDAFRRLYGPYSSGDTTLAERGEQT